MANTYTQIHLQFVFAVKNRNALIHKEWKDELFKYITGIVAAYNHKLLAINGVEDHIHILVGMRPTQSVSELLQDIKGSSSKWINDKKFLKSKFEWQQGFGAFSYSKSDVKSVIKYIENQEIHHNKQTFHDEYIEFLNEFDIEYDTKYIFLDPI